eukprot:6082814-Amphidinium_carterae.1
MFSYLVLKQPNIRQHAAATVYNLHMPCECVPLKAAPRSSLLAIVLVGIMQGIPACYQSPSPAKLS